MASRSATAGPGHGATAPGRCAHCGARLVPGNEWCSLCLTPVGSAEPDLPEPSEPEPAAVPAGPDPIERQGSEADQSGEGLTNERIDQLLERLAAAERTPDPRAQLGILADLHGRAGGLLLAGAIGLILLAGGMLSLYLLGSLI